MNLIGSIADAVTGAYILSQDKIKKGEADQLLFSSNIINKIKTKEISGKYIFAQLIPKGSSIKVVGDLTGRSAAVCGAPAAALPGLPRAWMPSLSQTSVRVALGGS